VKQYPEDPGFEKDSDTSEAAAESMVITAKVLKAICLRHIEAAEIAVPPGLTCDEVEVLTGGRHQSVSARIRELVLDGSIYDTGLRRPTRSGRKANVYRIKTATSIVVPAGPVEATLF
jgi:hypothetical protein